MGVNVGRLVRPLRAPPRCATDEHKHPPPRDSCCATRAL